MSPTAFDISSSSSSSSSQLRGKGVANVIVSHRQQLPTSHLRRTLPSHRCLEIPQGLRCSRKWIWLVFGKLNNNVSNERKPTQSGPRRRLHRRERHSENVFICLCRPTTYSISIYVDITFVQNSNCSDVGSSRIVFFIIHTAYMCLCLISILRFFSLEWY